jgi:DNA-directed RNA polymerase specialized sigma24 family protein
MPSAEVTCWTMIRDAAGGAPAARDRFARVYRPVVTAYLVARWRGVSRAPDTDDAAQDVFVECFRAGGLLEKADPDRAGGFRAFLLGAARNVARRHEARRRLPGPLPIDLAAEDTGPAEAFDRAWARALLREAGRVQKQQAEAAGPAALRRVQLLRMRFGDGLAIRDIAERWGEDAARLHHEYATARDEFRAALREVVAFHHPGGTDGAIERACGELLGLLA